MKRGVFRLGGAMLAFLLATLVARVANAAPSSRTPIVEVIGFNRVGLFGATGPVVVLVHGKQAQAIRTALAGLPPTSSAPECMESSIGFKVSLLSRVGAPPTYVATEADCPTPGRVSIAVDGKVMQLSEDCQLRSAVIAALPRGQAEGTRRDKAHCSL